VYFGVAFLDDFVQGFAQGGVREAFDGDGRHFHHVVVVADLDPSVPGSGCGDRGNVVIVSFAKVEVFVVVCDFDPLVGRG
jgi:hypothetical protein